MMGNNAILQQRFLEQLVRWLRQQRLKEPDFRRMARSGAVAGHSQKYAVFEFSRRHKAYLGLLADEETRLEPQRDVLGSWVTALTRLRGRRREILERCLPFLPAGETYQQTVKSSNVVWVQTAWGSGGRYERLELPPVRDCLFTFARHALRYSFELLRQQDAALEELRL